MSAAADHDLARLWDLVARRLERNGLSPQGIVSIGELTRSERFALAGLLSRPVTREAARVDLAVLDRRIREAGLSSGLVALVQERSGPLVDRPALRATASERRRALYGFARSELVSRGLASEPWVEEWLSAIRPVISRLAADRAPRELEYAIGCIARLPRNGSRRGRTELASQVAGNAHALDDGTVMSTLVLRAIALQCRVEVPRSSASRRALWESIGVTCDEVSTTVLTYGLRPPGTEVARPRDVETIAATMRDRSDAGCETHLTLRDLKRIDRFAEPGQVVWITENPRVLEAAMDAGSLAAMVCTAGNPTITVTTLLERLASCGASLAYHGDFDWPGIAIANRVAASCGARPWRMSSSDYEEALAAAGALVADLPRLEGPPVEASWDPSLGPAMERAGRAVHEEAMLETLVGDLVV